MNRNIKSIGAALLAVMLCVSLAGCRGKEEPASQPGANTGGTVETDINSSEYESISSAESGNSESAPGSLEEDESVPLLITEGDLGETDEHGPLVPKTGAELSDDTPLNIVCINGTEFDILDCTVQDICRNGGVARTIQRFDTQNLKVLDYNFFGEGFKRIGGDGGHGEAIVQIEALRNGGIVAKNDWEGWDRQLDLETEVYSDYEVKGISCGANGEERLNAELVQFCGGAINLCMEKEEIEAVLGRGYEVAITDSDIWPDLVSYYKTDSATMIITYKERSWGGEPFIITVVKN